MLTTFFLTAIAAITGTGKDKENTGKHNPYFFLSFTSYNLPVMAAIAVRKKVISIGQFSPCFYFQSLQISFYL